MAHQEFYDALAGLGCANFSDTDVTQAIERGLTPEQAAGELNAEYEELREAFKSDDYHGEGGPWDCSMNP